MTATPAPKSVVDRSIVVILSDPDDTPSRRRGISADVERKHRLYGTSLLAAATTLQKLNASTYATACTIFHRFYHRVSLTEYSVWSVALGSLLLATKVEDGLQQRTIHSLVLVFDHLYRKRRGCIVSASSSDKNINNENDTPQETNNKVLPMSKMGPAWEDWYKVVLEMENNILREVGFTLYWIPDSHPHKFLWEFLRLLFGLKRAEIGPNATVTILEGEAKEGGEETTAEGQHHHKLAQRAWNYCNDSCRLDLCVRFDSEVITCAAIHLAAADFNITLPMEPRPWWEFFLGANDANTASYTSPTKNNNNKLSRGQQVSTVANTIVGLRHHERNNASFQGFLPSLVAGGSFNDPDSFLWESRA